MENKRGTTVLLTVIGIATLLVAVVGATFAYFTATVTGDTEDTNVTVTAATLGTITFNEGDLLTLGTEAVPAYPGARTSKTFEVKADAASTVGVDYVVSLDVDTITFGADNTETTNDDKDVIDGTTNLQYYVCATLSEGSDTELADGTPECDGQQPADGAWKSIVKGTNTYTLATAKLGTKGAVDTWTVMVRLKETGAAQNYDQGKTFTAKLSIDATSVGYTTGADGVVSNVVTTSIPTTVAGN